MFEYPGDRNSSEEFNLLEIQAAEKKIAIDIAAAAATRSDTLAYVVMAIGGNTHAG